MAAPESFSLLATSVDPGLSTRRNADNGRPSAASGRHAKPNSRSPSSVFNGGADARRRARHNKLVRRKTQSRGSLDALFKRTWALPLALVLGTLALYAINPTDSNTARHFIFLSYKLANQHGQYGKGPWDFAFVCSCTIFLTFTREFIMHEVLRPLARRLGIKSRGKQMRFMEQMYTACYIAVVGPLGLYTMKQTPGLWYFATRGMYEAYPHMTHRAVFKFYYLFQAAFWVQQVIVMVLGQEKRRKDFKELIAHHIITIALIFLSYRFHFTYIGLAVYITHDISDFFLAVRPPTAPPSGNHTHSLANTPS
jgi:very-long-chain ceramide synthase